MYTIIELLGVSFFVLFLVATVVDIFSQIFPGLSAEEADMQDRVDRVQAAIVEYNESKETKR